MLFLTTLSTWNFLHVKLSKTVLRFLKYIHTRVKLRLSRLYGDSTIYEKYEPDGFRVTPSVAHCTTPSIILQPEVLEYKCTFFMIHFTFYNDN